MPAARPYVSQDKRRIEVRETIDGNGELRLAPLPRAQCSRPPGVAIDVHAL